MTTKLDNGICLYACSMGKLFRVTHICRTMADANKEMDRDNTTALIAEDNTGLCYLAKQYGSVAPSAVIDDMNRA